MDLDDLLTLVFVIGFALIRVIGGAVKFRRNKPPAEPSESMREILESLNPEAGRVVITRDDGEPLRSEQAAAETAPETPEADAEADAALLAEQARYAELAAQAEARLAAAAPSAYDAPEEEDSEASGTPLPEWVRSHARDAVTLSIILAPPPGAAGTPAGRTFRKTMP